MDCNVAILFLGCGVNGDCGFEYCRDDFSVNEGFTCGMSNLLC